MAECDQQIYVAKGLGARRVTRAALLFFILVVLTCGPASWQCLQAGEILSPLAPEWANVKVPSGAPNIVLILLDDVGFGDASTFGGAAETPVLDRLAARGLSYINFNTTGMCSPTRASLLTGRNHHAVGFGRVAGQADGFHGYDSIWKDETASIAEILRRNGYSTAAFGKWHNTPYWELGPTGPFDHWPTGLGFEYFYGFMSAAESHWEPRLFRNTSPIERPSQSGGTYHFTSDLVDEALAWIRTHQSLAPGRPYFAYVATGAVHEPHHVPEDWIKKYRGKFDQGWDSLRQEIFARQKSLGIIPENTALTSRPEGLPAWASLSTEQKTLYSRQMEVYAAFLSHADEEVGRLIEAIQTGPQADNTLILYIVGDNGSSGQGGLEGSESSHPLSERLQHIDELGGHLHRNDYAAGWAWAGVTPFQGLKGVASQVGAVRNPLVISWPTRIRHIGDIRAQFAHVNDIAATLYEAAGVHLPSSVNGVEQLPLDGVSLVPTFERSSALGEHHVQYFEMLGNRAIYRDGWLASARRDPAWDAGALFSGDGPRPQIASAGSPDHDRWELYDLREDFSQSRDVSTLHPRKLDEMKMLFRKEAARNRVYPIGADLRKLVTSYNAFNAGRRDTEGREFSYYPGLPRTPSFLLPSFARSSYRISATLTIGDGGAEGVIAASTGGTANFALYVKGERLVYETVVGGKATEVIVSRTALPHGRFEIAYEFVRDPESARSRTGIGRLYVQGILVAEGKLSGIELSAQSVFGVGRTFSSATPTASFDAPFAFTGQLNSVRVRLQ